MSRSFGVQRAGLITDPSNKEMIANVIREIIGYGKVDLSQDRLAEILLSMLDYVDSAVGGSPGTPGTTTVAVGYNNYVLTVTVNGVSASANLNPIAGGGTFQYDAGNGVYIRASGLGVTAAKAAGLFTLTIPANVVLKSARIHGDNTDLDGGNRVTIKFDNFQDITNSTDIYPPTITLYDRIVGSAPTDAIPWVYNISNSPQYQISAVGVNTVSFRFLNMNAYLNWGLKLNF